MMFRHEFNTKLDIYSIPEYTTTLIFGINFNKPVDNLPPIITLLFGDRFNQKVEKLPNSISSITFGDDFNQSVDFLPRRLNNLKFGYNFNQTVSKLPKSISWLIFGEKFNQCIDHLPSSITELSFGYYFNKPLCNFLNTREKSFISQPPIIIITFDFRVSVKTLKGVKNNDILIIKNDDCDYMYEMKNSKHDNISFSKTIVDINTLLKKQRSCLFWNIKKIPYGCVYTEISI